jgi:mRNA-degrading endonuclease RelE of RelBE toxin-antitoxin system
MYSFEFTALSLEHLKAFKKNEQRLIVTAIESQLTHQPHIETRNRKKMRTNKIARWELRIGKYRVFYNLNEPGKIVIIEVIGFKIGSLLLIGGKRAEL